MPGGIDTYADILDKLAILFDIKCNPIQLNFDNEFPPIEFCSYFPLSLDGSLWPYLDYNSKIRRQVMICEVIYHNCYFYFCDIQIDENNKNDRYVMFSIHAENFTKLSEEKLKEIIFLCSKNHGRWLNSNEMLELVSYKFKHNMKDSENYAKRYFNYIHTSIMESNLNLQTPLQNTISSHDNIELNLNDSTDTNKTA